MSLANHLEELRRRHETMDRAVREAQTKPAGLDPGIAEMKRRKLLIKDEIVQIEQRLSH